ncbi:MAG: Ig-like domain-containing protein [Desulfuromonadales bacterium]|nr:Ig-like domain-containing protein [Desulfuromonadales bacterium]
MIATKLLSCFACLFIIAATLVIPPTMVTAATYTYDALNRIKTVSYETGGSISYTYDAAGNTIGMSVLPDATAPTITGRTPASNASGVTVSTAITITLSEPVSDASALSAITLTGPGGSTAGQVTRGPLSVTFTPSSPLATGTVYTVSVAGLKDLSGNTMAGPVSWTFATAPQPTSTVTVRYSGDGAGNIHSVPGGISCTEEPCSVLFTTGAGLTLHADPSSGSLFDGWFNGGCSGTGDCALTPGGNTEVTSRFILIQPARISATPPTYFDSLNSACNAITSGNVTVEAMATTFTENLSLNQGSNVLIRGGFDAGYGSVVGSTVVQGVFSIQSGAATVDRLVLR